MKWIVHFFSQYKVKWNCYGLDQTGSKWHILWLHIIIIECFSVNTQNISFQILFLLILVSVFLIPFTASFCKWNHHITPSQKVRWFRKTPLSSIEGLQWKVEYTSWNAYTSYAYPRDIFRRLQGYRVTKDCKSKPQRKSILHLVLNFQIF